MNTRLRWSAGLGTAVLLLGLIGCGSGVNEALYQTASAAGRTALDIFLTELANALADTFDQTATPPADDGEDGTEDGNGDGNWDVDDGDGEDVSPDELTSDPDAGQAVYADNGCAPCHCDDGSGGCAMSAPGLVGASFDTLSDDLGGDSVHFGQGPLSNQELVDLEAYLGSL